MKKLNESPSDVTKIDKHLSVSFLLISLAVSHIETAEQILRKYGLCARQIKHSIKAIEANFDRFDSEFQKMMSRKGRQDFSETLEEFGKITDEYAEITIDDYR